MKVRTRVFPNKVLMDLSMSQNVQSLQTGISSWTQSTSYRSCIEQESFKLIKGTHLEISSSTGEYPLISRV